LQIAPERIGVRDPIEISIEAEHVQHGGVRTDRDAHPAALDAPKRHDGHPGSLGNQFRRQAAPQPRSPDALSKVRKPAFNRREECSDALRHAIILA